MLITPTLPTSSHPSCTAAGKAPRSSRCALRELPVSHAGSGREGLMLSDLPVPGQELVQAVLRLVGNAVEDVGQLSLRVDTAEFGGVEVAPLYPALRPAPSRRPNRSHGGGRRPVRALAGRTCRHSVRATGQDAAPLRREPLLDPWAASRTNSIWPIRPLGAPSTGSRWPVSSRPSETQHATTSIVPTKCSAS